MNNNDKADYMSQHDCGWEDILDQAEDLYREQMVEGLKRWPPASNPKDSKRPPTEYQVNLTQAPHPGRSKRNNKKKKGKGKSNDHDKQSDTNRQKGNGKHEKSSNGNGGKSKNGKQGKKARFQPPGKNEKPIRYVNGEPLFEKEINDRTFQWCSKCDPPRWSTTHNSGTHVGKVNAKENPDVQTNYALVPDPSIWLSETIKPQKKTFRHGRPLMTSGKSWVREKKAIKREKAQSRLTAIVPHSTLSQDRKQQRRTLSEEELASSEQHLTSLLGLLGDCIIAMLMNPTVLSWVKFMFDSYWVIVCAISIGDIVDTALLLQAPLLWGILLYTSVYGQTTLFKWYPDDTQAAAQPPPWEARRSFELAN